MSFIDDRARSGRERQQRGLIEEAGKAGARMVESIELSADGRGLGQTTAGALRGLFGGRMSTDAIQVLRFDFCGWSHCYVQPFSGVSSMPGEHFGVLNGSLAAPATLRPGGMLSGPRWDAGHVPEVAQHLSAQYGLSSAIKALKWEWQSGFGQVDLDWGLQLRSRGDGTTEVVMQAGRYGGFTTPEVGFSVWFRIVRHLSECLYPVAYPAQRYLEAPRFISLFDPGYDAPSAARGAVPLGAAEQADALRVDPAIDYPNRFRAALAPHLSKRVWTESIPPAKHANIYQHVLPEELAQCPLLCAIDLTTFGSAKDAVVATPTHLVSKEFDQREVIELGAIRSVVKDTLTTIVVEVAGRGHVSLPLGVAAEAVRALVGSIVAANQTTQDVRVSGFVGEAEGQLSEVQARALSDAARAALSTDDVQTKFNAAASLLTSGNYQGAIDAYSAIAHAHPDHAGACYGQIGAGLFFLRQYPRAIEYYEAAKRYGANWQMMDDNIREAMSRMR